jgi:hypothetical protein
MLILRFLLSLVCWFRAGARFTGICPLISVFSGIELLEKSDVVMIPMEKFDAHAIFQ